jgi:hypothetical protein
MPIKCPPTLCGDLKRARQIARSWEPLDKLAPADAETVARAIAEGIAEGRRYGLEIGQALSVAHAETCRSNRTNRSPAISAADAISTYILAKDSNRPQLMHRAFAQDCELEMIVKTDAISFPSSAKGPEQITQVLVTSFSEQYENIRTFCFSHPNSDFLPYFHCEWLVGMSARQGGSFRIGCGHYGWYFGPEDDGRVKKLVIDIEIMCVLPAEGSKPIMQWLAALPYPWCSNVKARESIPAIDALQPIESFLRRMETSNAPIA